MKENRTCILFEIVTSALLVMIFHSMTFSQNVSADNLTWEADEATDLQTSASVAMKCLFKTSGDNTVEWIQKKGQMKTLYTVTSVEGSWPNVSASGSIVYTLERNGKACKMTLEKNASGTFVTMDFSKAGEYIARHRFRIKSVQ